LNIKFKAAVAKSGAMEVEADIIYYGEQWLAISKKGRRSLKNQTSRGNFLRKVCFALLLAIGYFSANAQDLITLRNGDQITARVAEITLTEIKYKRFDNLDGPTITNRLNP